MVNGVVSLRCPACTRPFLSLPQQAGAMVTCPHCARSAPRESYTVASNAGAPPVTSLPIQRRVIPARPLQSMAFPGTGPAAVTPPSPAQPPAWPRAPEQPPLFSPQQSLLFPPAPAASPGWSPPPTAATSPFGVARPPGAEVAAQAPTFFMPPADEGPAPASSEAPVTLGLPTDAPPTPWAPGSGPSMVPFSQMVAPSTLPEYEAGPGWQPRRDERNVPLGLFLVLVLGFGGWLLWQNAQPPLAVEFKAPEKPNEVEKSEMAPASPVVTPPVPPPEPEIRRAELPLTPGQVPPARTAAPLDLVAAGEASERLLKLLLESDTLQKRASAVAQADEHQVDLQEFFGRGAPKLKGLKPSEIMPRTLPGQEEVPLFQVMTDKNPKAGALMRLVPQEGGGFLLDWPLFAETHERRLAQFLEKKSDQPGWYHVVLRRSHALELSEAVRSEHLVLSLQSSADGSVQCLSLVPSETPLARFLERETEWGSLYVARLLLQHRTLASGEAVVVILDCEGAVTGAVFPSGAAKR